MNFLRNARNTVLTVSAGEYIGFSKHSLELGCIKRSVQAKYCLHSTAQKDKTRIFVLYPLVSSYEDDLLSFLLRSINILNMDEYKMYRQEWNVCFQVPTNEIRYLQMYIFRYLCIYASTFAIRYLCSLVLMYSGSYVLGYLSFLVHMCFCSVRTCALFKKQAQVPSL